MRALLMPNVGEGVTEGTVARWLRQAGDRVRQDEPVVEVETDKALVEVPAPIDGVLARTLVAEGQTVSIGAPLAEFEVEAEAAGAEPAASASAAPRSKVPAAAPPAADALPTTDAPVPQPPALRNGHYSPVVLRLAAERGIDLARVQGTGSGGRVTRQDVLRLQSGARTEGAAPAPAARATAEDADAGGRDAATAAEARGDEVLPLSRSQRTMAERMSEAHSTIPVAWMAVEADVTGLVALRARHGEEFERREGVHLTYLPYLVEAIVTALRSHPGLNASFGEQGVTLHHRYHIGIAVSTPTGLMVPVIRDAEHKPVADLAREIAALAERARSRRITVDELRGATFTVDNTGAFGSLISQPIVPPGQVAILTTESIRRAVRVRDDDSLAVRSVMYMAISFDHRALDGAEVGTFMRDVRARVEAIGPERATPQVG